MTEFRATSGWRSSGLLVLVLLGCGGTAERRDAQPAAPTGGSATGQGGGGNNSLDHVAGRGGASSGVAGTQAAGAAGDPSAVGEGGVGGDACAGVEQRCRPGERVCDPLLGKLGICDECGAVTDIEVTGQDCVRQIVSDKESNGVCVVLGKDRFACLNPYPPTVETILPSDVLEVLLPDDSPPGAQYQPCFRRLSGGYSCISGACERVAVGNTGACGICGGELHCEGDVTMPPDPQAPIDISVTDSSVIVLGALGVQAFNDSPKPAPGWRGAPARLIVDHQLGGCIISDRQELACWVELSKGLKASSWSGDFSPFIATTLPRACGLDQQRQLYCGDVFADSAPSALGEPDTIDFVASSSVVCTLSVRGRVKCFNEATSEPREVPPGW